MSEVNKTLYVGAKEIAAVLGKHKTTIERMAGDSGWKYIEEASQGKYKKRLYVIAKLPQDIQFAVLRQRLDEDIVHFHNEQLEQQNAEFNTAATAAAPVDHANKGRVLSNRANTEPVPVALDAVAQGGLGIILDGGSEQSGGQQLRVESPARSATTDDIRLGDTGQLRKSVAIDGKRQAGDQSMDGGIVVRDSGGNLSQYTEQSGLSDFSEDQRAIHNKIALIMRWLSAHPSGMQAKALRDLNRQYAAETLSSVMVTALNHCKLKASGKPKTDDILTRSTVSKWEARYKEQGNYVPKVRQKDMSLKPWHIDLSRMLDTNKSKKCHSLLHEKLAEKYGDKVSIHMVNRWISEKRSKGDTIKGENSGMQLRAKQAYQPRTSEGLKPGDEVHADGWATHFTAPHPITGEFVTYEIWDFHDVATRYVPPFGIGLTECFEVIAKGVENAIRDIGVMCILQTDSTKIVKNNTNFTGDPVKSISDKAGITIVHPVTVGNAQANGIAENFHAWLDKQSRELATYQASGQDSLTLRRVKKITAKMVKAANMGELELRDQLKAHAEKVGGGLVFGSYREAVEWLERIRIKWNNKPHRALKKVRDSETQKLRHQTPLECLNEFKANGWEPILMLEADLADLFLVHKPVKVYRGAVKPYGGMLFRNPELDHWEGEKVIVAYDSMNYEQVWVKDLKGRLICIAPFLEPTGYRSVTAHEAAQEKRAVAQIKNKERQIKTIEARAGIVEHNVIDVTPSVTGLKLVQEDWVEPVETPLKSVDFEPAPIAGEAAPMGFLEMWAMLQSEEKEEPSSEENETPISKDGTAGK